MHGTSNLANLFSPVLVVMTGDYRSEPVAQSTLLQEPVILLLPLTIQHYYHENTICPPAFGKVLSPTEFKGIHLLVDLPYIVPTMIHSLGYLKDFV